ncbi:hypothetical protein B566_EDAN012340 [Ephemera danica]|nr:hypothetical protein B566_EDAN012340 [Ephemera danica]
MQQNLHIQNTMYVTPILLLLLASNVFADGNEDWQHSLQGRFSSMGINTKEISCVKTAEPKPVPSNCPSYEAPSNMLTLSLALDYCHRNGKRLATPDTEVGVDCLRDFVRTQPPRPYWIAASNENSNFYTWQTTNRIASLNNYWDRGFPQAGSNSCVYILGHWLQDVQCRDTWGNPPSLNYICERIA